MKLLSEYPINSGATGLCALTSMQPEISAPDILSSQITTGTHVLCLPFPQSSNRCIPAHGLRTKGRAHPPIPPRLYLHPSCHQFAFCHIEGWCVGMYLSIFVHPAIHRGHRQGLVSRSAGSPFLGFFHFLHTHYPSFLGIVEPFPAHLLLGL